MSVPLWLLRSDPHLHFHRRPASPTIIIVLRCTSTDLQARLCSHGHPIYFLPHASPGRQYVYRINLGVPRDACVETPDMPWLDTIEVSWTIRGRPRAASAHDCNALDGMWHKRTRQPHTKSCPTEHCTANSCCTRRGCVRQQHETWLHKAMLREARLHDLYGLGFSPARAQNLFDTVSNHVRLLQALLGPLPGLWGPQGVVWAPF